MTSPDVLRRRAVPGDRPVEELWSTPGGLDDTIDRLVGADSGAVRSA